MTKLFFFISLYFIALALFTGCGKETCTTVVTPTDTRTFGTLEVVKCQDGDVLISVTPSWLPGGEVSHVTAACGKAVVKCQ